MKFRKEMFNSTNLLQLHLGVEIPQVSIDIQLIHDSATIQGPATRNSDELVDLWDRKEIADLFVYIE